MRPEPGAVVRVVVVDDQELVRSGLAMILESDPSIEVVAEAADGREGVARTVASDPDVVCMDVQMPGLDGLGATREIVQQGLGARVLVLTTFDRDDYLFEALASGASGFLLKNAPPERLVEAVHVLARGEAMLAPEVVRRVVDRFAHRPPGTPRPDLEALHALTEREQQVMGHLVRGRSNSEIAAALHVGEATVKTHVSRVLDKLGVRDRVQLVVWAYERGVVVPGS